jgi:hypothetical protein
MYDSTATNAKSGKLQRPRHLLRYLGIVTEAERRKTTLQDDRCWHEHDCCEQLFKLRG